MLKTLIILLIISSCVTAQEKELLGSGKWTFEFLPKGIQLPEEHAKKVQDYHGVAVDNQGRVYIGYYTKKADKSTRTVARFNYNPGQNPPFKFDRFLGDASWVKGRIHGVNIIKTHHGDERLLLVYNTHKVILCDLDGNIDKEHTFEAQHKHLKKASDGHYSPHSKHLGIYDGYATNILHEIDFDGSDTGKKHGSKGNGLNKTNTAHGVGLDSAGNYVIADRGNKRLVWRKPDFSPLLSKKDPSKQIQLATPGLEVCNVQFKDDYAVLPCLNSKIAFLTKSDSEESGYKIDSYFTMPKHLVKQGFDGIHDVNFSVDGKYLIVAVWQRNRKVPPRLFALKKVAEKSK